MTSTSEAPFPGAASPQSDFLLKREYWCFISYRHADNKVPGRQWATWLHQALETYEVPADLVGTKNERGDVIPERIFPVFRDEEELPADAELSKPIEMALKRSRFMVVLCSPQAAVSRYVGEEIVQFKQLGMGDRILAAMIEGEPNASDDPAKGGAERECFPLPLRHEVLADGSLTQQRTEPIAADFRLPDGTAGWTSPVAYRQNLISQGLNPREAEARVKAYAKQQNLMLLKIVAGILGLPLGVLTQRDIAYQLEKQRQQARVLQRWLLIVGAIGVVALVSGFLAYQNGQRAEEQRKNAQVQQQEAERQAAEARRQKTEAEKQTAEAERQRNTATERGKEVVQEKAKQDQLLQVASRGDNESAMRSFATGNHAEGMAFLDRSLINYPSNQAALISTVNHAFGPASAPYAMRSVHTFEGGMTRFATSDDSRWLAAAGNDLSCRIIEISTGLEVRRIRLDGYAICVTFSPDSKWLAVGCKDKTLRIYEVSTGNRLHLIPFEGSVTSAAFSQDGMAILAGSEDFTIRLFSVISGMPIWKTASDREIKEVLFSPNGQWVAAAGKENVCWILDATTGKEKFQCDLEGPIKMSIMSPDGNWLAFIASERILWLLDTKKLKLTRSDAEFGGVISQIRFSPDNKWLAAGSIDKTCRIIAPATAKEVKKWKFSGAVYSQHFSPDGRCLLVGVWEKNCYVMDIMSGTEIGRAFMGDYVMGIRYSADGSHIIAGNNDGALRILETTSVREINRTDFASQISDLSVNADGHHLAVRTEDGIPHFVNIHNGEQYSGKAENNIRVVQFSPDGTYIAAGGNTGVLMLNEVKTRKSIFYDHFQSPIHVLKFSSDGKYLGLGCLGGDTWIVESATQKRRGANSFTKNVRVLEFSPDGKWYAVGGEDQILSVMESATGKEIYKQPFESIIASLAFSPDGRYITVGTWNGVIRTCDVANQKVVSESDIGFTLNHLKYSRDGRFIAATAMNKTLRLLDAADCRQLYQLEFTGQPRTIDYSPDGRLIVIGTDDNILCIVDAASGQIVSFMRFGGRIMHARFFPNSQHLAFTCSDQSVRVIDCRWLEPKVNSPNEILNGSALRPGVHFDAHGRLETRSAKELEKAQSVVTKFLYQTPQPNDEWQRSILNWARLPAERRTTSPWSSEPIAKAVGRWIMNATTPETAVDCANQALWHPLEPISLITPGPTAEDDDLQREKFLAKLTLKRLREADSKIYDSATQWHYITWVINRLMDKRHLLEERLEGVNMAFDFAPPEAKDQLKSLQQGLKEIIAKIPSEISKPGSASAKRP